MTKRRRKWIIAATLLVLVIALAWGFERGGGRMELKLILLGRTNDSFERPSALILATNSGQTTILIGPLVWTTNHLWVFLHDGDYPLMYPRAGWTFPARLEPGETMLLTLAETELSDRTYAFCRAQRHEPSDRLYLRLMRTVFDSVFSSPPGASTMIGPITNLPPATASPGPGRVARP